MNESIVEQLQTPVAGKWDILVCGGGVAGISSALAARRMGKSVLLIEKSILLGGLATNGLISWYEPLCDGRGEQMITGIAEELLRLSIRNGPDTLPEIWRTPGAPVDKSKVSTVKQHPIGGRFGTHYSPTMFMLVLDELMETEGVDIRLDMLAARPVVKDGKCEGIVAESKSGREFIRADAVVDATGDADILYRAGIPCINGKNYLSFVAHGCRICDLKDAKDGLSVRKWMSMGSDLFGGGHPEGYPYLSGTTCEEVTKFILDGRRMLRERMMKGERNEREVTTLPGMAQFRTTRRIDGDYTLTEADKFRSFEDSVGLLSDFCYPGDWYELPLRCIKRSGYPNLFAAGRIVSAAGWAWDVTRVIPAAALSGQAAGIAAALQTENALDIGRVQRTLQDQGVRIHPNQ